MLIAKNSVKLWVIIENGNNCYVVQNCGMVPIPHFTITTVWTLIFTVLNFRGLRIFAFFAFLFSRMRVPQYYIKYVDYISVLICSSPISHIAKHVWAARRVGVAIAKQ